MLRIFTSTRRSGSIHAIRASRFGFRGFRTQFGNFGLTNLSHLRLRFAQADSRNSRSRYAVADQVVCHYVCAAFGQSLIVFSEPIKSVWPSTRTGGHWFDSGVAPILSGCLELRRAMNPYRNRTGFWQTGKWFHQHIEACSTTATGAGSGSGTATASPHSTRPWLALSK